MNAADRWAADSRARADKVVAPGAVVAAERREPIDLDKVQVVAWAVVGAVLYLVFAVASALALATTFDVWVGCLVGLLAGALPAGYSLVKSHQRTAAREERAHQAGFRGEGPPAPPAIDIPTRL